MDSSSANALDAIPDPAFSGMSFAQVCALASRLQSEVRHAQALNAKMDALVTLLSSGKLQVNVASPDDNKTKPAK